jgi:soluble lytic murein transglycosylase
MQVMPDTAQWIAGKISFQDYDLTSPDDNVKLGTWYLDYTHQKYQNNSLLAVASYNAGPGNVDSWVKKYGLQDPDVFVEQIPFPETKGYVESVFGNYWNYLRIYNPTVSRKMSSLLR